MSKTSERCQLELRQASNTDGSCMFCPETLNVIVVTGGNIEMRMCQSCLRKINGWNTREVLHRTR